MGSSAKTDDLDVYKKAAGIEGMTNVETTSDDAERSKPHPDIFIAALNRLKMPAEDVVVVGDTPYDVEAAKKAGMKTTGLLCGGFSEGVCSAMPARSMSTAIQDTCCRSLRRLHERYGCSPRATSGGSSAAMARMLTSCCHPLFDSVAVAPPLSSAGMAHRGQRPSSDSFRSVA